MKILLVSSFFPPSHVAGTEKRTLGYALGLRELGCQVQVVCAGKWNEGSKYWGGYDEEEYRELPVRRVNLNWQLAPDPNRYLYCNPQIEDVMSRWLESWQPDLVHVTSCYTLSASVIQAVKSVGLPLVLTLTDFWFLCPSLHLWRYDGELCDGCTTAWECLKCMAWGAKVYRWPRKALPERMVESLLGWSSRHPALSRLRGLRGLVLDMDHRKAYLSRMLDLADCVTAPSEFLSRIFREAGVTKPIRVIHSGHDLGWQGKVSKTHSPVIRFGYVGQIAPEKGVHLLVSAFFRQADRRRSKLLIFGNYNSAPGYKKELDALIDEEADVSFRGQFPHECLGEVLSEIDVLVVPSTWHENNPRVIQEAFAAKIPVIGSDVGGIAEFVHHDVNGLLFKRGDAEDLAHQMQRVLYEDGLLDRLGTNIPPVKTFDKEVAELNAIYKALCNSQPK